MVTVKFLKEQMKIFRRSILEKELKGQGAITMALILSNAITMQAVPKGSQIRIFEFINSVFK
jgi:hypothetical protein